jgi:hypothetical protein
VGAGASARRAHLGDDLAGLDLCARLDEQLRGVRVQRVYAIAVVELDDVAVAAALLGRHDGTAERREGEPITPEWNARSPVNGSTRGPKPLVTCASACGGSGTSVVPFATASASTSVKTMPAMPDMPLPRPALFKSWLKMNVSSEA